LNCSTGGTSFLFSSAVSDVCANNVTPIAIAHNCRAIIFAPDTGDYFAILHRLTVHQERLETNKPARGVCEFMSLARAK
jgi:hypothetical protein